MEEFKLLAVRPLIGCHKRFLKNLTAGHLYRFYNSAVFLTKDKTNVGLNQNVEYIDHDISVPQGLYSASSADNLGIDVNICAIAGKNGAGKSTIVELLFAAVYLLSVNDNILEPNMDSLNKQNAKLRAQFRDVRLSLLQQDDEKARILEWIGKMQADGEIIDFEALKTRLADFIEKEKTLTTAEKKISEAVSENQKKSHDIKTFYRQLKLELYYRLRGINYRLTIDGETGKSHSIPVIIIPSSNDQLNSADAFTMKKEQLAEYFFYTIAVNYSHYALNADVLGDWINSLFHKNDGYTTPLVINPMRDSGNFDINKETVFAKYRLLSNALTEYFYTRASIKVTDHQHIHRVRFTLNIPKIKRLRGKISLTRDVFSGATREANLVMDLFGHYFPGFDIAPALLSDFPLKKEILNYIVDKVDRISELYPGFEDGYQFGPEAPSLVTASFIEKVATDRTHVTYKLRQAIHFLRFMLDDRQPQFFRFSDSDGSPMENVVFEYSLQELIEYMAVSAASEINGHIPPSLFNIDFVLVNIRSKSTSLFDRLSSGEQQLIHTIQSVIYHLNNVQSAHNGDKERCKYRAVNIVYDEIELYFHPEYQRRFVSELLAALTRLHLAGDSRITAMNILFLTHSPFILSDIPAENIMLLDIDKKGKSVAIVKPEQTFGANIHDLLADSFFLNGTLMGRYAEEKVNTLIDHIKQTPELSDEDKKLMAIIGDPYLKSSLEEFSKQRG